ncbi:putative pectinesterase inhibitor domain-containing protein [Rosa chinensis]|uniref:Putative pectinesterase inhibitor domain-containing protein n=1 Tax=Rosa chinensis TaxID=74649 RepID=A0A2P6PRR8_ROSCH|nr:pectinesterase inhibitor [Rosa chinensis]PRQ24629.1 putative pectinesterase inhibitor domain-containing protein [Rosa chinensis]
MESPLGFASTLFFASLFLLLSSPSPTNASTRLVESVCNEVVGILKGSNSECLKALELDPRTGSASTYEVLAPIAIDLAIANAKDSEAFIKNLLKNNSSSEAIKQCADSYNIVVRDFVGAKEELKEDPLSANYDIKIAGDNVRDCENALSSKGLQVPEIASRNHAMFLYSNIGFVITNHID